jgi:hypothetical protein
VSSIFNPQPLDQIRNYFGSQVALYFAWLGHYTTALVIPGVFGLLIYYCGLLRFGDDGGGEHSDREEEDKDVDDDVWYDDQVRAFIRVHCFYCCSAVCIRSCICHICIIQLSLVNGVRGGVEATSGRIGVSMGQ